MRSQDVVNVVVGKYFEVVESRKYWMLDEIKAIQESDQKEENTAHYLYDMFDTQAIALKELLKKLQFIGCKIDIKAIHADAEKSAENMFFR